MTNGDIQDLVPDEVADGGIRDNTGIEFALSQAWGKDPLTMLVSDAGRPFDSTPPEVNENENLSVWGERMQRVIDIMFNRISLLIDARQPKLHKLNMHRKSTLRETEDESQRSYLQPLIKSAAFEVPKISTDLVPLTVGQIFALIRQGYDNAGEILAAHYRFPNSDIDSEEAAKFWKELWPGSTKDQDALTLALQSAADNNAMLWELGAVVTQVPGVSSRNRLLLAWAIDNRGYAIPSLIAMSCVLLIIGYLFGVWFPLRMD